MRSVYEKMEPIVLRRTDAWRFSTISVSGAMIDLLDAIDSRKTIGQLRDSLGMTDADIYDSLSRLFELGLVEKATPAPPANRTTRKQRGNFRGIPYDVMTS